MGHPHTARISWWDQLCTGTRSPGSVGQGQRQDGSGAETGPLSPAPPTPYGTLSIPSYSVCQPPSGTRHGCCSFNKQHLPALWPWGCFSGCPRLSVLAPFLACREGATNASSSALCFNSGGCTKPQQKATPFLPTTRYVRSSVDLGKPYPGFAGGAPVEPELLIIANLVTTTAMPYQAAASAAVPPLLRSLPEYSSLVSHLLTASNDFINKNSKRGQIGERRVMA